MRSNQPVSLVPLHRRLQRRIDGIRDYRDRISVVVWIFVLGLALSLIFEIPTAVITFRALGSPVGLNLSPQSVMALLLAVTAAAGTQSIIRLHPVHAGRRLAVTWAFWALPTAIAIISVVLLPKVPTRLLQVFVLLLAGSIQAVAFYALYGTVEPGQPGFRRSRLVLDALAYGAATATLLVCL